jgi:tetratricopeptide (TPR) repeat protein
LDVFKRRTDPADIFEAAQTLQVEALQCTIPGDAAARFNRAGDLLLVGGDILSAIESYGRAVDALIEGDRAHASMALCRKIIRIVPHVVRARCTLTWLGIGAGYAGEVRRYASEYITYAELSGREDRAAEHLRYMCVVAEHPDVRQALAECLLQLGDAKAADDVFGAVFREQNEGVIRARASDQLWESVRQAALLGPRAQAAVHS